MLPAVVRTWLQSGRTFKVDNVDNRVILERTKFDDNKYIDLPRPAGKHDAFEFA